MALFLRASSLANELQIDPNNDPRDLEHNSSASTSPEIPQFRRRPFDDDSDPDEADIDEHLGPHGFAFRRSTREGADHENHHSPGVDPVFERFVNMIQGFGPPRTANGGLFAQESTNQQQGSGPRITRTTFRSGPFGGGMTSVTIVSGGGPLRGNNEGSPSGPQGDPFQAYESSPSSQPQQPGGLRVTAVSMTIRANLRPRIFSNVLRDMGPPDEAHRGGDDAGGAPPMGFARSLHDILNLINPANAMAGDAVYTQEALDRIVTNLMEANPQSNAAPPASEQALRNLERKTVDKAMLGEDDKVECSICIDDMKEGEKAVFLPCKHWFHEDCVVLWLKEHNTCPICRTPVEKPEGNNNNAQGGDRHQAGLSPGGMPPFSSASSPGFGRHSPWFPGTPGNEGSSSQGEPGQGRSFRYSRPPSQSQSRLNEALRNLSSIQQGQERNRTRDRATASGFSYDTANLQRRNSHSPTSPRNAGPEEAGARMRQRSPSQSSRRSDDPHRSGGHGPMSWLRDRFSGGSGSGTSRDTRRYQ